MDRKMRAARNNAVAKARKRAVERRTEAPRCGVCGEPDEEHTYVPVPKALIEALREAGGVCEVIEPRSETKH